MYNFNTLQNSLFGLVGFEQTQDTATYPILEADLLVSRSGLLVSNEHTLIQPENIYHIIKEVGGAIDSVRISDYLRRRVKGAINKSLLLIQKSKEAEKITKSIIENVQAYGGQGRIYDTITKTGRFVGFAIQLNRFNNLSLRINKIGVQFTQPQTDLNLYLYHSSQSEPIEIKTITTTKTGGSFEWVGGFEKVYFNSDDYDAGGTFYVGYYEDDIVGQAIRKDYDFNTLSNNICYSCGGANRNSFLKYNKYFTLRPVQVAAADIAPPNFFDIAKLGFTNNTNFGLNFDFSVFCDLTNFIIQHEEQLAELVSKQIAVDILTDMANNTETSGLAEKLKQNAQIALYTSDGSPNLILKELYSSGKRTDFNFSDLDSPCLPNNKKGVKYGNI